MIEMVTMLALLCVVAVLLMFVMWCPNHARTALNRVVMNAIIAREKNVSPSSVGTVRVARARMVRFGARSSSKRVYWAV